MGKSEGKRDPRDIGAVDFGVGENRFKRRVGHDKFSASAGRVFPVVERASECLRANLQNFAGAVAQQNLIAIDAIMFCQRIDQRLGRIIRIAARKAERIGHRLKRCGGRAIRILVRTQAHDSRGRRFRGWRRRE